MKHKKRSQHGMTETKIYRTWCHMKGRCLNPKDSAYHRYGGRGISICERWIIFENFLSDMGLPPDDSYSIERIDNNGNYCAENCRWATWKEQCRNRTTSKFITYKNETKTLAQWCDELKINYDLIQSRLSLGMTFEQAITTKKRRIHKSRISFEKITFKGETKTLKEWCYLYNLSYESLRQEIKYKNIDPEISLGKRINSQC